MINIIAKRIDQSFNLETMEHENYLVFELPNGTELTSLIDIETAEYVIKLSANGSMPSRVSVPTPPEHVNVAIKDMPVKEPVSEEDTGVVQEGQEAIYRWSELPDESLSRLMKTAFQLVGAPPEMTAADIQGLINSISEDFGEEEWESVKQAEAMQTDEPAMKETPVMSRPNPQPKEKPKPAVSQPTWHDGSPIMSGSRPPRTVPADEMGYPVVDNNDVDPGEIVAGGDVDEDGVGQL